MQEKHFKNLLNFPFLDVNIMIVSVIKFCELPKNVRKLIIDANGSSFCKDTAIILDYCIPSFEELTSDLPWEDVSLNNWISEGGDKESFSMENQNSEGQWELAKMLYDLKPEYFVKGFENILIDCRW